MKLNKWDEHLFPKKTDWTKWLAIFALIGLGAAYWYAYTTREILEAAHYDSSLNSRPYVVVKLLEPSKGDTGKIKYLYDTNLIPIPFRLKYVNPGRTPAANFKSYAILSIDESPHILEFQRLYPEESSKKDLTIVLMGEVDNTYDKELIIKCDESFKTDRNANIILGDEVMPLVIFDPDTMIIYYHSRYTYTDIYEKNEYEGSFTIGFIVAFKPVGVKIFFKSYKMN